MAWRLARSLETLRAEWDRAAPNRSKASDGTLGDPAHAARASRHNPNNAGVVCALDLTHDPADGCDIHAFARRHVRNPHPQLEYVISNGEVAKRRTGYRWEPYTGANEHRAHAHFAVGQGPDSEPAPPYDSTVPWGVTAPAPTPPEVPDMDATQDARLKRIETLLERLVPRASQNVMLNGPDIGKRVPAGTADSGPVGDLWRWVLLAEQERQKS